MKDDEEPKEKIHAGWMTVLLSVGLALIIAAYGIDDWDLVSVPVSQSVLTNFGTAFVSAGILLYFEPRLRRVVTRTAKAVAAEETTRITADVTERVATLESALSDRIAEARTARRASQDEALAALLGTMTHDTLHNALLKASEINALWGDSLTVQGTEKLGELTFTVAYDFPKHVSERGFVFTDDKAQIVIRAAAPHMEEAIEEAWTDQLDFSRLADRIEMELIRQGAMGSAQSVEWEHVIESWKKGIEIAFHSRHRDEEWLHLQGPLGEIFGRWYLTAESLEAPDRQYVAPRSVFVRRYGYDPRVYEVDLPDKPEWATQEEWDYAVLRCTMRYEHQQPEPPF